MGTLPALRVSTRTDNEWDTWAEPAGEGHWTASLRWVALKLEGPGTGTPGNDQTIWITRASEMLDCEGRRSGGRARPGLVNV